MRIIFCSEICGSDYRVYGRERTVTAMQRKSQSDKAGGNHRRLTALLILTAMLCGLLTGCGSGTESQSASLPDSTLPIESRVIPDTEESSGVLSEDTPPTVEETYIENRTAPSRPFRKRRALPRIPNKRHRRFPHLSRLWR